MDNIEEYTFHNCYNITNVEIPEGIKSIGNQAFAACYKLEDVTISNTVESIGDYAFRLCKKMKNITLPSNITYIGSSIFWNCENLSTIYCEAVSPPLINTFAFETYKSAPTIYVPMKSLADYKSAYGWNRYVDCIKGYEF